LNWSADSNNFLSFFVFLSKSPSSWFDKSQTIYWRKSHWESDSLIICETERKTAMQENRTWWASRKRDCIDSIAITIISSLIVKGDSLWRSFEDKITKRDIIPFASKSRKRFLDSLQVLI
jgi:hypothetical protein